MQSWKGSNVVQICMSIGITQAFDGNAAAAGQAAFNYLHIPAEMNPETFLNCSQTPESFTSSLVVNSPKDPNPTSCTASTINATQTTLRDVTMITHSKSMQNMALLIPSRFPRHSNSPFATVTHPRILYMFMGYRHCYHEALNLAAH